MKHFPLLLSATALLVTGFAASAQEIDSLFGDTTAKSALSASKVMPLFLDTPVDGSSPALIEAINKELDRSTNIDIVRNPMEAAKLVAPVKVTLPKDGKSDMKVSFQFSYWRGSEQDFSVSCAVAKPQDCAKAIRTRVDRLVRDTEL